MALLVLAACSADQAATISVADPTTTTTLISSTSTITTVPVASPTTTAPGLLPVTDVVEYPVTPGSRPHDVAPAADGTVWYSGQGNGTLGRLDPSTGTVTEISLGPGSAPHGVIVGGDGSPWLTDSGLNALVRVDPTTGNMSVFELPGPNVNLNTAVFDQNGILWFTGQAGAYGSLDPSTGEIATFESPGGRGPYGITVTPSNEVFYASLAGNHVAQVDVNNGTATVLEPPTPQQGSRRVWSDSEGTIWVSQWEAGQVASYQPSTGTWHEWGLPGEDPSAYAVYVDETDRVWLTDFTGAGSMLRFDPPTESFETFALPTPGGNVRQLLGRPGEVWGAESAADALIVIRFG